MSGLCSVCQTNHRDPQDHAFTSGVVPQEAEPLVIEIARELYDRFVMGGWEPQDAYPMIRAWLSDHAAASPAELQVEISELEKRLDNQRSSIQTLRIGRDQAREALTETQQRLRTTENLVAILQRDNAKMLKMSD